MAKIYLVSCVSKKLNGMHKAKDIYISPLFKLSRAYVEKNMKDGDRWFILSALYGFLSPEKEIETYDKTLNNMSVKEKKNWASKVYLDLKKEIKDGDDVVFLAGRNYCLYLCELLSADKIKYSIMMEGKKLGERLQWLNNNI